MSDENMLWYQRVRFGSFRGTSTGSVASTDAAKAVLPEVLTSRRRNSNRRSIDNTLIYKHARDDVIVRRQVSYVLAVSTTIGRIADDASIIVAPERLSRSLAITMLLVNSQRKTTWLSFAEFKLLTLADLLRVPNATLEALDDDVNLMRELSSALGRTISIQLRNEDGMSANLIQDLAISTNNRLSNRDPSRIHQSAEQNR